MNGRKQVEDENLKNVVQRILEDVENLRKEQSASRKIFSDKKEREDGFS